MVGWYEWVSDRSYDAHMSDTNFDIIQMFYSTEIFLVHLTITQDSYASDLALIWGSDIGTPHIE